MLVLVSNLPLMLSADAQSVLWGVLLARQLGAIQAQTRLATWTRLLVSSATTLASVLMLQASRSLDRLVEDNAIPGERQTLTLQVWGHG